jgi:hypothetical protein
VSGLSIKQRNIEQQEVVVNYGSITV